MHDQDVPVTAWSPEITDVIIPVPGRHARFRGYLIEEVSSRTDDDQLRFTVIRLYRVADERKPLTQYLISVIGRSVVYHAHNGRCGDLGVPVTVAELATLPVWDELAECPRCRPRDVEYMDDAEEVNLEMDRINPVRECRDAHAVRERLEQPLRDESGNVVRDEDGEIIMVLSAPAERLLRRAALKDAGIAEEIGRVEDL